MRKGDIGWSSLASVILFMVGASVLILFLMSFVPELKAGFGDSICKMSAWMRASTLGSPIMQSILSIGGYVGGGFSTMTLEAGFPLACKSSGSIGEQPVTLDIFLEKISRESVRCWDNFGQGSWDPLVMYEKGQYFNCYEEIINITCDPAELTDPTHLTKDQIMDYFETQEAGYSGFNMTYSSILDARFFNYQPVNGKELLCDGTTRRYLVGVYFVDSLSSGLRGDRYVALPGRTLDMASYGNDQIVLITWDLTGQQVII